LGDDVDGFVATDAIGSPSVPRISMTLTRILSASLVVLLVSSEAKKEKVLAGLQGPDPMNPVSYLLAANHPIVIEWPDGSTETIQGGGTQ
ncbi:6-phosphogluconolactonase, partial [Litorivicinus sp.]|nr:6-phosphogluconolactonase [Litorivicinus sp.]